MGSRLVAAAGLSAVALLGATAFAGQASARSSLPPLVHQAAAASQAAGIPAKGACYSENSDDGGGGVLSTATDDYAGYTSAGAAGFIVKKSCTIKTVTVTGVYGGGSGPADSVTVTFYRNRLGEPGKVIGTPATISAGLGNPDFVLDIPTVKLTKGRYFVSVQASMDYRLVGGWYWELTQDQQGKVDQWENNGGAFGVCPTWDDVTTCVDEGNDFMVALS